MNRGEELITWLRSKRGHKVVLVSAKNKRDFGRAFLSIRDFCHFPIEGAMWECPIVVRLPNHESPFFPISINGNVEAWEAGIKAMSADSNREFAVVKEERVCLSVSEEIPFDHIVVDSA